jgi:hypothetical protein
MKTKSSIMKPFSTFISKVMMAHCNSEDKVPSRLRISQTVQHVNKACNPRTSEDEEGGL